MWNEPDDDRLNEIPRFYETENQLLSDKLIYLHFFIGGCDWYVAEFDGDDLFFGYAILNGDSQNSEWGNFSFGELKAINISGIEIDCEIEMCWQIKKASRIKNIKIYE